MGELIHNRYELIEALGVGGMGAVFRARDQHLNREVALKVARVEPPDTKRMAEATLFLKREARALGRLKHPSIPVVYDYSGETHDPAYLALELVEGANLGQLLAPKKSLPVLVTLSIVQRCAAALAHAHQTKLVHGDIKPCLDGLWLHSGNPVQGAWKHRIGRWRFRRIWLTRFLKP